MSDYNHVCKPNYLYQAPINGVTTFPQKNNRVIVPSTISSASTRQAKNSKRASLPAIKNLYSYYSDHSKKLERAYSNTSTIRIDDIKSEMRYGYASSFKKAQQRIQEKKKECLGRLNALLAAKKSDCTSHTSPKHNRFFRPALEKIKTLYLKFKQLFCFQKNDNWTHYFSEIMPSFGLRVGSKSRKNYSRLL